MWNGGGVNVLYAEGLSAGCACKMDMRGMCASAFASAVYLRSAAVIDFVQEFVVQKQRKCSVGFTSASDSSPVELLFQPANASAATNMRLIARHINNILKGAFMECSVWLCE